MALTSKEKAAVTSGDTHALARALAASGQPTNVIRNVASGDTTVLVKALGSGMTPAQIRAVLSGDHAVIPGAVSGVI